MGTPLSLLFTGLLIWRFVLVFYTPPSLRIKNEKGKLTVAGRLSNQRVSRTRKPISISPTTLKSLGITALVIAGIFIIVKLISSYSGGNRASKKSDIAFVVTKNTSGLPIRETPDIDAADVAFVSQHSTVRVVERFVKRDVVSGRTGSWCKVEDDYGNTGYMFDGWMAYEKEVIDLVKSFIEYLGEQDFSSAFALQNNPYWKDYNRFASKDRGYGGIMKTELYSEPYIDEFDLEGGMLDVVVEYLAVDVANDTKWCSSPGIIYDQTFKVDKQDDGLRIVSTNLLDRRCKDGTIISD